MSSMSTEQQRLLDALRQGRVAPINLSSFARLLRADESDDYDESDDGDYDDDDDDDDEDYDDSDNLCDCCGSYMGRSFSRFCGPCLKYEIGPHPEEGPADAPAAPAKKSDDDDDEGSDYW